MRQRTRLLAMLLAGMIVLAGCSRPAADTPAENDDPAPEQQEQQEEQPQEDPSQSEQQEPDQQPEQPDEETADEQTEETDESADEEETSADAGQQDEAGARQGCYRLFDSGFEITVEDPFYIAYDELMGTMQVTIPDEAAFQAYIYYDPTGQTMDQLESSIKTLEESYEDDPTVSNMQTQVDEQENGLFSISFSYSAGATEGSPAGFYFIHYQKTQEGLLTANIYSDRASNSEAIQRLVSTIQLETENAQDYPTGQE